MNNWRKILSWQELHGKWVQMKEGIPVDARTWRRGIKEGELVQERFIVPSGAIGEVVGEIAGTYFVIWQGFPIFLEEYPDNLFHEITGWAVQKSIVDVIHE